MAESSSRTSASSVDKIPAGCMPPWDVGELPPAPVFRWRNWTVLVGPGLMMAGANIGGGEWLFGPAVTAQYGGTVMWIASLSILFQVFYNLEVMRFTLYCGEPIVTGYFRCVPGPKFWAVCYLIFDFGGIWPYLASNAAVPLAAFFLGDLPGPDNELLVKVLGYVIFFIAFIPLIFGGKIYNALEKVMIAKIVVVLGYLSFIALFVASAASSGEIFAGFLRFGTVPLRAQTVLVGDRYTIEKQVGDEVLILKGTFDSSGIASNLVLEVRESGMSKNYTIKELPTDSPSGPSEGGLPNHKFTVRDKRKNEASAELTSRLRAEFEPMLAEARRIASQHGFLARLREDDLIIELEGTVADHHQWNPERIAITEAGETKAYSALDQVPEPYRTRAGKLAANQGIEPVGMIGYLLAKGRLPDLNWGVLAAFAAIAGAGGLSNTQFSNYARDKGWGMGPLVGAIPSAVGGKTIELSHVGMAFRLSPESLARWKGWFRHILRDQVALWMGACVLGMALPSILSLEFIRNAPIEGNKVAAMTADGISQRAGSVFWPLTLLCGFIVLAPSQIANMDGIFRRWTEVIWTGSSRLAHLEGNKVKYVYYTIMVGYGIWGVIALWISPNPLVLAIASTVFLNFAIGFSAFQTLWVNMTFLPRELRPNWIMRLGLIGCGIFFLGIFAIALNQQLPQLMAWLSGRG